MPPKAMQEVVSDSTDPATKRPDLPPAQKTCTAFHGMNIPDSPPKISLPATVQPSNAWEIFRLFINTEMVSLIVNHTNERVEQLPREGLKPRALLKSWYPVTVEEIYAYIGIRIYMGLYDSPCVRDYWAEEGPNRPLHRLKDVMARERYEAIHARMRLASVDPRAEFQTVFERLSYYFSVVT